MQHFAHAQLGEEADQPAIFCARDFKLFPQPLRFGRSDERRKGEPILRLNGKKRCALAPPVLAETMRCERRRNAHRSLLRIE